MLRWYRLEISLEEWTQRIEKFSDRTLFHSSSWLRFLENAVGGERVLAVLREGNSECGYFAGVVVRKLGLRILGSPLPGWTSSYMGFVLRPEIPRCDAVTALKDFAFQDLNCVHMELMDRRVDSRSLNSKFRVRNYDGFEIDLLPEEDQLFANLFPACRRCIRKALRSGVTIEEASDADFAHDFYEQLEEVFARQGLRPTYDLKRVQALIRHLQPTGNLLLLRAFDQERHCIATGIFPAMHDRAYFWGGASRTQYRHLRPNESLMWCAIRYWKRRGIRYFDFSGAGDYKRKYGAYEITVPWLRISRYPLLPMMRNCMLLMTKFRQRWHGVRQLAHVFDDAQHVNHVVNTQTEPAEI